MLRITTPPARLYTSQADLPESLLELVQYRVTQTTLHRSHSEVAVAADGVDSPDEVTTLVLALIDSLPLLPPVILEEYLNNTANIINHLQQADQRQQCRDHIWEVLSNGEMDIDRSHICLVWWTTRGGREMLFPSSTVNVLSGDSRQFFMSGALQNIETEKPGARL